MKKNKRSIIYFIIPLIVPVVFLFIWQTIASSLNNIIILPNIINILDILLVPHASIIGMGSIVQNVFVSLLRVLIGYFVAVIIAIPLGIFMGYRDLFFRLFNNFVGLFRPIPPLAWVPLVLAWFGVASLYDIFPLDIGNAYSYLRNMRLSMIFIIFIGAFFPIVTSTINGVQNVKKILIDSARTLGASEKDIFIKILVPAAAPTIVNGMRIGLGVAWMCLVSAEMLPGSVSGVGYLITHAYIVARTDVVIAGMISIGIVGALLDMLFRIAEQRKFSWQRKS